MFKKRCINSFLLVVLILLIFPLVSASFGFDESGFGFDESSINEFGLSSDPIPPINFSIRNVNSSNFWDGLDTINTTQMEDNGGVLNILESWLTTFWNSVFVTKTTDDLIEGSTNLYDNRSWNQTLADTLYADISVVSNPFDQSLNTTDDVIFNFLNVTGDIFSNSHQVISYQRTVNIKNVTMTAVI